MLVELLLLINVVVGVNPDGSELLAFGPKNHSNVGEGILGSRRMGSKRVAEHISKYISPAVLEPEEEMITGSTS